MTQHILFLIKKNFKHEIRSWKYFLLEIVIIVTCIFIISLYPFDGSILKSKLDPEDVKKTKFHENVAELDNLKHFRQLTKSKDTNYQLFYTPDNKLIKDIVKVVSQKLELNDAQGFPNKREMLKHFNEYNVIAALTFNVITSESLDLSIHFPSKLRTISTDKCGGRDCLWLSICSGVGEATGHSEIYESEGFLPLQHQIFSEWIKSFDLSKYEKIPSVAVNSFLHHTNWETCIQRTFVNYIWFFYNFLFFVPFLNLLWKISREIEEDFPRHYSIYGFSNNQHWIAHTITALLHLLILDIIVIGFLMIELPYGPNGILYHYGYLVLFLIFYNIILSLSVFILATLISNAKTSILLGASLWLVCYAIFSSFLGNSSTIDAHVLLSFLLFSNNFVPFGMIYFERQATKRIWEILALQMGIILLYTVILKCVERLRSGRYMRCLKKSKNCNTSLSYEVNWASFEYGPVEGQQLMLKNVYVYECCLENKEVLKNMSMKFFKNEISIILGPRSCGKTTLITVLAGWLNYSGHIYFEGNTEIAENLKHYRRNIDVSFTNNALCDLFSVEEQLHYIIVIKNQDTNKTEHNLELNKWLTILKSYISDPRIFVQSLTFDQKRLLSLCCLLSGGSRIVLLDEPTLHMTADGQTAYWRLLKQEKLNRVIAMTTDSIDEASAIGDRIGILYRGSLKAWGTSFHLRSNLNTVVYMVVFITRMTPVAPITQLMQGYITNLKIHNIFHNRIVYILPANKKKLYQRMLIDLEKKFTLLGIRNIYMTSGDLNDVYMNLTSQKVKKKHSPHISESLKVLNKATPTPNAQLRSALYYKKLLYQAPNIAPVAIMIVAVIIIPIISEMFTHFTQNPSIQMGFDSSFKAGNALKSLDKNKYIEISCVNDMYLKSQVRSWFTSRLTSSLNSFKEDLLHNSEIFNKFGAIERTKERSQIDLWINEKIFHSAAMTLNLAHNIIFSDLYPNSKNMMININNEPIWIPIEHKISLNQMRNLQVPLTMGIIMPLTISSFIVSLIDERQNHMDTLQKIAGATTATMWITNFVWDYTVYWILTMLYFLVMCIYTIDGFVAASKLVTLMLLGFYGIPSLLLVYVISMLVSPHRLNGFLKVFLLQMTLGSAAFLIYRQVADEEPFWFYPLMFSPTFALLVGMAAVSSENEVRVSCRDHCAKIKGCNDDNDCSVIQQCCTASFLQWSFPGILPSICFLVLTTVLLAVIFFGITIYRNRKKYSTTDRIKQMSSVCYPYDDDCVVDEKVRISNMNVRTCKGYAVLVDQLEYEIPKRENRVRAISFALENSKCMGIYGPHSSGKSHLIEQLVGFKPIRFGEVYICGNECKTNIREAIRNLGYCPQNNGYIEGATPRQFLTLFFMINGFPESKCYSQLRDISLVLNLGLYMNTRISELPSNVRRRVNIAVALIVQNKVLIFDEPTRGMSSYERYLIWSVIRQARDHGNAIIFTSQDSMELEELADFIIMVDQGEMLAIESPQCIRKIYTLGLYLEIKLYSDGETLEKMENNLRKDIENLQRFIMFLHSDSELVKCYGNVLEFYLPIESISYSYLFGALEKNRQRLNISEYIVCQGSLATAYDNLRSARKQKIPYVKSILEV